MIPLSPFFLSSRLRQVSPGWAGAGAALCALFLAAPVLQAQVPLTGANGREVEFAGVKSAGPAGLVVQVQRVGDPVTLSWDRFDLEKLKENQPDIHRAYLAAQVGEETTLNLGMFAPAPGSAEPEMLTPEMISAVAGRYRTSAGTGRFTLQLPPGGAAKAVLLLSMGDDGNSERYMGNPERNRWSRLTDKHQIALLAYQFPVGADARGEGFVKAAPFVFAEHGSGEAVLKALENFARDAKRPELAEAPLLVYGLGVPGAAFAYNFTQAFPQRVLAAVAAKGAFYAGEPSEASAGVPLLFVTGEYDEDINLWRPEQTMEEAYEAALPLKPHWTQALEFRAGAGDSPELDHFVLTYLDRMMLVRLSPEGELQPLDASRAWTGDLNSFKPGRAEEDGEPLSPDQTWLPDGEIARMWEEFANGDLKVPALASDN